jgi:hypothetical protein
VKTFQHSLKPGAIFFVIQQTDVPVSILSDSKSEKYMPTFCEKDSSFVANRIYVRQISI